MINIIWDRKKIKRNNATQNFGLLRQIVAFLKIELSGGGPWKKVVLECFFRKSLFDQVLGSFGCVNSIRYNHVVLLLFLVLSKRNNATIFLRNQSFFFGGIFLWLFELNYSRI